MHLSTLVACASVCSKAVIVMLLLSHFLMFKPLISGRSVLSHCFVMYFVVHFLVLHSSWRDRESWLLYLYCLPGVLTLGVLWRFREMVCLV